MTRLLLRWTLAAAVFGVSAAGAHTRSQSHSVWEFNGADVDLVMTIPVPEADRLSADQSAPSDDRLKAYLTERVYPLADGRRCPVVPPVQTLSAAAGFRKFDFTFKCATASNLQVHSAAFFDLVASHTNFAQVQNALTGEFTEQLITAEHQHGRRHGRRGRPPQERALRRIHPHGHDAHLHRRRSHVLSAGAGADFAAPARSGVRGHRVHHRPQPDPGAGGDRRAAAPRGIHRRAGRADHRPDRSGEHRRSDAPAHARSAGRRRLAGIHGPAGGPGIRRAAQPAVAGRRSVHRQLPDDLRPIARRRPPADLDHPGLRPDPRLRLRRRPAGDAASARTLGRALGGLQRGRGDRTVDAWLPGRPCWS